MDYYSNNAQEVVLQSVIVCSVDWPVKTKSFYCESKSEEKMRQAFISTVNDHWHTGG